MKEINSKLTSRHGKEIVFFSDYHKEQRVKMLCKLICLRTEDPALPLVPFLSVRSFLPRSLLLI